MNAAARRRTAALIAVTAAIALAMTGCAQPDPKPAPNPEPVLVEAPTPTPTMEPEPVDPLTTVTGIVVRPEHLEFRDAGSVVVSTLSYDAEAAVFIDTLASVLGSEPDGHTESEGGNESWPTTEYWWDSGVRVHDDHEGKGSIDMNVNVLFVNPVVGDGVTVSTVNGFQPGGDAEALAAELGEPWYGNGYDQVRAETGPAIGERFFDEYENAYSVAVNVWAYQANVAAIFAPWNFGIGHV